MEERPENTDPNVNGVLPLKIMSALSYQKLINYREDHIANLEVPDDVKLLLTRCPAYQHFHAAAKQIEKLIEDIRASDTTIFNYTEADFDHLAVRVRPAARFLVVVFLGLACSYSEKLSPVLGHPVVLVPLLCWVAFFKDILPHEYPLMLALTALCHKYHLDFLALRSESERRFREPVDAIKKLLGKGIEKFDGNKTHLQFLMFQFNRSQTRADMLSTLLDLSNTLRNAMQVIYPTEQNEGSVVPMNV